jgi:hypothetical protein
VANHNIKQALISQGVKLICPESTTIENDLKPELIARDVTIYGGCRIGGDRTSVGPGSILGEEAPVTIQNCQIGENVRLKGGFFSGATIMDGIDFGSAAHVRPGTLLEEQVSCGHAVGLKQTLLMPFVTLGSLINFCDCLMASGTGPKNHGEVGSSYIHLNFTAHQDKATASLIGDVPAGVMLDKAPIFLGGQGGMVGPRRIAYGSIVAAGTICRRDILEEGKLVFGETGHRVREHAYDARIYGDIDRICHNCFTYIGNLHALHAWYCHVRPLLTPGNAYAQACLNGARDQIRVVVEERIKQLTNLGAKLLISLDAAGLTNTDTPPASFILQRRFVELWPKVAPRLELPVDEESGSCQERKALLDAVSKTTHDNYVTAIQTLPPEVRRQGTAWLQGIVDNISSIWKEIQHG